MTRAEVWEWLSGWVHFLFTEADMCVSGSNLGETEMKNEQRQQATCYHFKYFLSTYPELKFNKLLQIRLNVAHAI